MWSCFTLGTGWSNLGSLMAVRFAFGMAEAGAYPTATRAIYNWFPMRERGPRWVARYRLASRRRIRPGNHVVKRGSPWLRVSYYLLAVSGSCRAGDWFIWFRDRPPTQSRPRGGERFPVPTSDPKGMFRDFLASRNFYLILGQYFASNFTFFICFSWLLPYIQDRYRLSPSDAGLLRRHSAVLRSIGDLARRILGGCHFQNGHTGRSRGCCRRFGLWSVCGVSAWYQVR